MRTLLPIILVFLALPITQAQEATDIDSVPYFSAFHEATLSSSAAAWTIQVPARNINRVQIVAAVATCTVATTLTFEAGNGGTPATSTALTAQNTNNLSATPTATVYHTSNAGNGTVVNKIPLTANVPQPINMEFTHFPRDKSSVFTYNLRTSAVTGTCSLYLLWKEKGR